jgi:hypothetical protein
MDPKNAVSRRWKTIAVLATGVALGSAITATPVSSHVGGTVTHLWRTHIRPLADGRYYTKARSDARYYTKTAADARYYTRPDSDARYYSRTESDALYYTRTESDSRYLNAGAAAGGDLTGTYPAPSIGPNAVGSGEVTDRSLSRADVIQHEGNVTVDPPSIPANGCVQGSIAVPGMQADLGDEGWLYPSPNFFTGTTLTINTYTSINDTAVMRYSICNVGAAAVDPPSGNWHYLVVG